MRRFVGRALLRARPRETLNDARSVRLLLELDDQLPEHPEQLALLLGLVVRVGGHGKGREGRGSRGRSSVVTCRASGSKIWVQEERGIRTVLRPERESH